MEPLQPLAIHFVEKRGFSEVVLGRTSDFEEEPILELLFLSYNVVDSSVSTKLSKTGCSVTTCCQLVLLIKSKCYCFWFLLFFF